MALLKSKETDIWENCLGLEDSGKNVKAFSDLSNTDFPIAKHSLWL